MSNERELEAEIDRLNQEIVRLNNVIKENMEVLDVQEKEIATYRECHKQLQSLVLKIGT